MTKKDYVAVAKLMKELWLDGGAYNHEGDAVIPMRAVEEGLADIFAKDNPLFDRGRFLKACCCGIKDW